MYSIRTISGSVENNIFGNLQIHSGSDFSTSDCSLKHENIFLAKSNYYDATSYDPFSRYALLVICSNQNKNKITQTSDSLTMRYYLYDFPITTLGDASHQLDHVRMRFQGFHQLKFRQQIPFVRIWSICC